MPQNKEISFSDPKLSEIFTNKKAQLIVSKSRLTRKINRTTSEFDSLRVFVTPLNPSKFERESLSFLAHRINASMPEYIAKVETLTEELESLLSGCHLDQADTEQGKVQEEHRVAELSSLESGSNAGSSEIRRTNKQRLQKSHRRAQMSIHPGEKPFTCRCWSKSFATRHQLGLSFVSECQLCGKSLSDRHEPEIHNTCGLVLRPETVG